MAISAGDAFSVGLKADGSVVAWGQNSNGQLIVPEPNADFVDIAAGTWHCVGLKSNGSVVAWGFGANGELNVPEPNAGFVQVGAAYSGSAGLKSDGSIVRWGNPAGVLVGDYVAISLHAQGMLAALKSDGSVEYFSPGFGVPTPNLDFTIVASGKGLGLALKDSGTIFVTATNSVYYEVPEPNSNFFFAGTGMSAAFGIRVPETGACCSMQEPFNCSQAFDFECLSASGVFLGDASSCSPTLCDCNENAIVDKCELDCGLSGSSCDVMGCGLALDCNANLIPDDCDLNAEVSSDCNNNGIPDECDIVGGSSTDTNSNGIPDDCEFPFGDIDHSGSVSLDDILCILSSFAGNYACAGGLSNADIVPCGGNGQVNLDDILAILQAFAGADLCP